MEKEDNKKKLGKAIIDKIKRAIQKLLKCRRKDAEETDVASNEQTNETEIESKKDR